MIRKAEKKDVEEILNLYFYMISHLKECNPKRYSIKEEDKEKEFRRIKSKLIKEMKNKKSIIVVFEEEKIKGFGYGKIQHEPFIVNDYIYGSVEDIVVHKNYQNKGIGTAILKEIIKFFTERGIKRAELIVDVNNSQALKKWEKEGFNEQIKIMDKLI